MSNEIKVQVVAYSDRPNLVLRYRCPLTDKYITRNAKTAKRREAERLAIQWEAELRSGVSPDEGRMSWADFRYQYEDARLDDLTVKSALSYASTFNAFETLCRPKKVGDLTTARIREFKRQLRAVRRVKPATVARHLRVIKLIARWAVKERLLAQMPVIEIPGKRSGAQESKGRAISLEEFERMLAVTEKIVGPKAAESWQTLLKGLWVTGMRISEIYKLRWDKHPRSITLRLNGARSTMHFGAKTQKSGKVETVPVTPDAVLFFEQMQADEGFVFIPRRFDGLPMARDPHKASKIVCKIGKAARVVVNVETGKCASAHDLRRSFGSRWAAKVTPSDLKRLMRHSSLETTMTYYVDNDAEDASERLWGHLGNISGNIGPSEPSREEAGMRKPLENKGQSE